MGSLSELVVRLCEMPLTEHNGKLFNELSGFVSPPSEASRPRCGAEGGAARRQGGAAARDQRGRAPLRAAETHRFDGAAMLQASTAVGE